MADIIQLLPESVANQIAAGEVVQRPASVVKELLENAIDAQGKKIKLIIKDAGKTLIQVIDNGIGMSESDALLSFERHATSKINSSADLFKIKTKGFRGEALASIAAVAKIEMKTRLSKKDIGTQIIIEASKIKKNEEVATNQGTSIAVKNLFFNVPARRNFLKSDKIELRHIMDEFIRVALAHPEIELQMHHNNNCIYQLTPTSYRKRIVDVFGKSFNEKLVPIAEETDVLKISGHIGKPESARKTRGEQFFFVNNRFIKHNYLHFAVTNAFEGLIASERHPSYFINLQIDPSKIDINIHPTKTEIKFEDEKVIYAILQASIKKALGQFNVTPSIDFSINSNLIPLKTKNILAKEPTIEVDPNFNPFATKSQFSSKKKYDLEKSNEKNWVKIFDNPNNNSIKEQQPCLKTESKTSFQLHNKYILSHIKSGFMIIHQHRAHRHILLNKLLQSNTISSQQLAFPITVNYNNTNYEIVKELIPLLNKSGFEVKEFGKGTIIIHATPSFVIESEVASIFDELLEQKKLNKENLNLSGQEKSLNILAKSISIKKGKKLSAIEMNHLIDELFACEIPHTTLNGKKIITTLTLDELDKRFN